MRRLSVTWIACLMLLAPALPALAQEDPLANSVLLPNLVGWGLVGLALLLAVLFRLWTSRGPR